MANWNFGRFLMEKKRENKMQECMEMRQYHTHTYKVMMNLEFQKISKARARDKTGQAWCLWGI